MEIRADIEKYKLNRKIKLKSQKPPVNNDGGQMYMEDAAGDASSPRFAGSDEEDEEDLNNMEHYQMAHQNSNSDDQLEDGDMNQMVQLMQ